MSLQEQFLTGNIAGLSIFRKVLAQSCFMCQREIDT